MEITQNPNTQNPDPRETHSQRATHIVLLVAGTLLAGLWLRVHSWESYMYAASAEGFFDIGEMVARLTEQPALPLSTFHPYHPATHALVAALNGVLEVFGWGNALYVAVVLNKLGALGTLIVVARIANRMSPAPFVPAIAVLAVLSTKAFLFAAFSGEAHIFALFFATLSVDRLLAPKLSNRGAFLAGIFYAVGVCLNLSVLFFGLVPTFLAWRQNKRVFYRFVLSSFAIGCSVFLFIPAMLFDWQSLDDVRTLYGAYGTLGRVEVGRLEQLGQLLRAIKHGFFARYSSGFSAGFSGGIGFVVSALILLWMFAALTGAFTVFRRLQKQAGWLLLWVAIFIVASVTTSNPQALNGTVYLVVPMALLVSMAAHSEATSRKTGRLVLLSAMLIMTAVLNVYGVVWPKVALPKADAIHLSSVKSEELEPHSALVVVEHAHVFFQEVWTLGHDLGITDQTVVFLRGERSASKAIADFFEAHDAYYLLSQSPRIRPQRSGPGVKAIVRRVGNLPKGAVHFSVDHDLSLDAAPTVKKRTYFYLINKRTP